MDGFSEENLSQILGNDPVATSVRIRIRQDEQAVNNLTLGYRAAKQEIEGMVKALEKSGLLTGKLTDALARVTGAAGGGMVGNTSVAGSKPIQRTPIDKGIGTNVSSRGATVQAGGQGTGGAPQASGTIQMTPLDKGVQTSTSIGQRLKQSLINYGAPPPPAPPGGPTPPSTVRGAIADAAIPAANSILAASGERIDRNRAYSLQADRVNMVFQQMKGMSQEQTQNVYRQPLTQYKLGAGGKNEVLAMEAMTGLKSSIMAPAIEAMRVQSGFSMTAGQATGMIENMASPEVVNRMFMMTGTSLIGPGGVQNDPTKVMQDVVKKAGLTNPDILRGAQAKGSISRNNLSNMGVTGALQDQYIQYAQMDLQFQEKTKGRQGSYDAGNKKHQKIMGIDDNFAMQAEETERRRGEREENFYSRQNDNFADLEKTTQKLIATMGKLEDVMSGALGLQIESSWMKGALGPAGAMAAGVVGKAMAGPIGLVGKGLGLVGKGLGWMTGGLIGDFVTADAMERRVMNSGKATTPSATTISAENKAQYNKPTAGLRRAGPQQPSREGLYGFRKDTFRRNLKPGVQKTTPPPPTKMLSRELTDAEMDEGWGLITARSPFDGRILAPSYSAVKREAIMAHTQVTYRGQPLTLAELSREDALRHLDPYTRTMFQDAAIAANKAGTVIGLTSGWRSPQAQESLWLERMKPSTDGTGIDWNGQKWVKKNPKDADVAPPGAAYSNHEHGLAMDVEGDIDWLYKNREKFGLENFKNVNNEPWHFQVAGLYQGERVEGVAAKHTIEGQGAGYNERLGRDPFGGVRTDPGGYEIGSDAATDRQLIQELYDAGITTSSWVKDVNGKKTPIGIDFIGVQKWGKSGLESIDFIKNNRSQGVRAGSMHGQMGSEERRLSNPTTAKLGGPTANTPYGVLTMDQAAQMLYNAGWRGNDLVEALAIMWRESGGDPNVINNSYNLFNPDGTRKGQDVSYGLFQHNFNPSQMNTEGNVRDWKLSGSPEDWAAGAGQDLYNPERNIALAYERYMWDKNHGGTGWGPWVNDGVSHLYGAENFVQPATQAAMRVGVYNVGDNVPKSATTKPIRDKPSKPTPSMRGRSTTSSSEFQPISYNTPPIDIKKLREHLPMPSASGLGNMSDRGLSASGAMSVPTTSNNNNITISPNITISTNGSSIEQELEGLARKVAGMLEKEVNRVMLRRT